MNIFNLMNLKLNTRKSSMLDSQNIMKSMSTQVLNSLIPKSPQRISLKTAGNVSKASGMFRLNRVPSSANISGSAKKAAAGRSSSKNLNTKLVPAKKGSKIKNKLSIDGFYTQTKPTIKESTTKVLKKLLPPQRLKTPVKQDSKSIPRSHKSTSPEMSNVG